LCGEFETFENSCSNLASVLYESINTQARKGQRAATSKKREGQLTLVSFKKVAYSLTPGVLKVCE